MHYDGDPDGCSATCTGPHLDDAPTGHVCGRCGGACYPVCLHQARPYEPWEGRTGADELLEV